MATFKRVPLSPTTMEAAAMTAGPVRNLMAIEKAAMRLPHAIILGCKAMNRPAMNRIIKEKEQRQACSSTPNTKPIIKELYIVKHLLALSNKKSFK